MNELDHRSRLMRLVLIYKDKGDRKIINERQYRLLMLLNPIALGPSPALTHDLARQVKTIS